MKKQRDVPARHEVKERGDGYESNMEKKEDALDIIASDVETVRRTLENLDLRGTSEGIEDVEHAIETAEKVTEQEFEREDEELERIQEENQEFEGEIQERKESSEVDVGKVTDAAGGTKTTETIRELERARDAALRDVNFLAEHLDRARQAREKSDNAQERLWSRIHGERKGW